MTVRDAIKLLRTLPPGLELRALWHDFMSGAPSFVEPGFIETSCIAHGETEPTLAVVMGPEDEILKARCRVCGCTNDDCSQCVEKTGDACSWVENDLCSACAPELVKTRRRRKAARS